ncbi:MAG: biotin carboxylase N-terminal domain-containing protein [Bacteriovoracaceae bacterium]
MKTIKRILIANRGEIAHRIAQTVRKMGIDPVIVYSDADIETLTVKEASQAIHIGAGPVSESYLDQEKILKAARDSGADAIHPGYGLLSENSEFAKKVVAEKFIWIGPTPESMERVASKSRAKDVAVKANVPVLSGHQGKQDLSSFKDAATKLGYPLLLKAAAGGGGRGIRRVNNEKELEEQLVIVRSEAKNAFGDEEILLEKFLPEAHHIEVQVFGDEQGNVVHLFERDCSAQRKNQKVIEESPSPAISAELRKKICESAVEIAKTAHYTNAGTVEFLVTPTGEYYFLEMNTRLQVEHPVTEMVTKLDLVEWQIRIARGEKLPLSQDKITSTGHSIELRLYAEDPYDQMRPQTGRIRGFRFPAARVDHFLSDRTVISPFYDSMLAKIIVHGKDREEARQKALVAIDETLVWGLRTNASYLSEILSSKFFREGKTYVRSLETIAQTPQIPDKEKILTAMEKVAVLSLRNGKDSWSNSAGRKQLVALSCANEKRTFEVVACDGDYAVKSDVRDTIFEKFLPQSFPWLTEGKDFFIDSLEIRNLLYVRVKEERAADPDSISSPMDGTIIRLLKKNDDEVKQNETVAVLEAMKMQTELKSPRAGIINTVLVAEKQMIKNKQLIMKLKKDKA